MNVNIRNRFIAFGVVIIAMFTALFVQLIQLTLVKGEEYAEEMNTLEQRTIAVSGARGSILDKNGLPLAYDEKSYNVQFYRDPTRNTETDRAYYTGIIIDTIKIVEDNSGETVDTFAIQYDDEDGYYFDWGIEDKDAKASREANWRENMYVGDKRTPEEIYLFLREKYQIPSEMGFEDARKVLSIWQDAQLASWVAYEPVDVAYNVSIKVVSDIETHAIELEGMSIAESTVRIYPRKTVLAHTIGYLGSIDDAKELEYYQEMGYSVDDLVGIEGIEESMEEYLTGNSKDRQGKELVEIDSMAVVQNVLSSTEPKQGNNVMLTVDIPLQLAVEASLEKNVPEIRARQLARYDERKDLPVSEDGYKGIDIEDVSLAESGAVVVLDVNSGDVLSIASYPSFDLNLFTGGISDEDFKALNSNEDLAILYNKAVSSRGTPGSIFKMVTGVAALMEGERDTDKGTTLYEEIDCEGKFDVDVLYGEAPGCWVRNPADHADQTIVQGLEHSCNYYFFTLAKRLGIDLLDKWGDKFGLTVSTGIELPGEAIGQIGNQAILFNPDEDLDHQSTWIPKLVKNGTYGIVKLLENYAAENNIEYDDTVINKTADELIYLMGTTWKDNDDGFLADENGKTLGESIREILAKDMRITNRLARSSGLSDKISDMLSQLIWGPIDTIQTGIGQGYVQVTPIAVARYVAAVANGGTVYETHLVDKVISQDGTVVYDKEPVVYDTLDAPTEYIEAIKEGMRSVVSEEEGTASEAFTNFPDEYLAQLGGKTGSAEVTKDIDLENNSWFVCFAPFEEPEIAVVVYVPHGYAGSWSICIAQDILMYYFEGKEKVAEQTMPTTNTLVVPGYEPEDSDTSDDPDTPEEE